MSDGTHVDDLLSGFMDGELDAPTRARVDSHLRGCARCTAELAAWRRLHEQLVDTDVPDPGHAYWSGFATRVQARLPAAAPAPKAPWVERVVGWFVPAERIAWVRVAGAFAVVTLVTYIGMRGFEPDERPRNGPTLQSPRTPPPPSEVAEQDVKSPAPPARPEASPSSAAPTRGERTAKRTTPGRADADANRGAPSGSEPERKRTNTEPVPSAAPSPPAAVAFSKPPPEALTSERRTAAPSHDSLGPVAAELAERDASGGAAKAESPMAGAAPRVQSLHRAELPPVDRVDAAVRAFVAAALAGDAPAARVQRDDLAATPSAADAMELQHMDAWLDAAAPERQRAALATVDPWPRLAALDALVWPRREQPALRLQVEELARRLLERTDESSRRERAIAYADWLARTAPDAAGRDVWQAALDALRP